MSVAPLTADEFGTFVAVAHKIGNGSIAELASMAELMSRSNAAAYTAQYSDPMEAATAKEIEQAASRAIANDDLLGHFGPIVYNCYTNNGELYYGELPANNSNAVASAVTLAEWKRIESAAKSWQDAKRREFERAEQNAVAFNEVGKLPMKTADELKQIMADGALIVATFNVNESDMMSDYHGGRIARRVVIGVRSGKRESFKALRKAAGNFPPTAEYGPGKDVYTAYVVTNDAISGNGHAYWKGSRSNWHNDLGHGTTFTTQTEADAFIAKAGEPHSISFDGKLATFSWSIDKESVEHRENWSMGGGNYLGTSRYGGWKVSSSTYVSGSMEFWKGK